MDTLQKEKMVDVFRSVMLFIGIIVFLVVLGIVFFPSH